MIAQLMTFFLSTTVYALYTPHFNEHKLDVRQSTDAGGATSSSDTIIGFDHSLNPNGPTYVRLSYIMNGEQQLVVDLSNASHL